MQEPKACTTCVHHLLQTLHFPAGDGAIHLCMVREVLPIEPDENLLPYEEEERESDFLGWDCDRARKQGSGSLCGPAGNLWMAKTQ